MQLLHDLALLHQGRRVLDTLDSTTAQLRHRSALACNIFVVVELRSLTFTLARNCIWYFSTSRSYTFSIL